LTKSTFDHPIEGHFGSKWGVEGYTPKTAKIPSTFRDITEPFGSPAIEKKLKF